MNIDAISAISDVGVLPGQIGTEESSDVVDGADLSDFQAVVQQLNGVIADAVVGSAVDCVVQPNDATIPETHDSDEQASFATYISRTSVNPLSFDSREPSWPDALPTPVTLDQWQPDISEEARTLTTAVRAELGGARQRSATPLGLDATPSTEAVSVHEPSLSVPVSSAIRHSELSVLSGMHSGEQPTIAVVTASSNGASFADLHLSSTPSLSSSASSSSLMASSLPEMFIAGGQHHARAVAHLPSLGTVQVEMTRASVSEVAVHVYAQELSVAALERCSPNLQHLVASTVQPAATAEAAIKEPGYAPGSESGIKIALSLTCQNQSQADSAEYQQQGRAESSRPVVEQLTIPARVTPVTALVDLLI